jgi:hypothetical protein
VSVLKDPWKRSAVVHRLGPSRSKTRKEHKLQEPPGVCMLRRQWVLSGRTRTSLSLDRFAQAFRDDLYELSLLTISFSTFGNLDLEPGERAFRIGRDAPEIPLCTWTRACHFGCSLSPAFKPNHFVSGAPASEHASRRSRAAAAGSMHHGP